MELCRIFTIPVCTPSYQSRSKAFGGKQQICAEMWAEAFITVHLCLIAITLLGCDVDLGTGSGPQAKNPSNKTINDETMFLQR